MLFYQVVLYYDAVHWYGCAPKLLKSPKIPCSIRNLAKNGFYFDVVFAGFMSVYYVMFCSIPSTVHVGPTKDSNWENSEGVFSMSASAALQI